MVIQIDDRAGSCDIYPLLTRMGCEAELVRMPFGDAAFSEPLGDWLQLTFTLHAHLPYVVNHGTWPHGMEWLHEAAAETYLPLLRTLKNLERDRIRFNCNLNLSPILLEQLTHPLFLAEFPHYLNRKITAAREDEAYFLQAAESQSGAYDEQRQIICQRRGPEQQTRQTMTARLARA